MKHMRTILVSLIALLFIAIIIYAVFIIPNDEEPVMLSGSVYIDGERLLDETLVKIVLDTGEIINQITTDSFGDFTVDVSDYVNENVYFIVLYENHSYPVFDEQGDELEISLSNELGDSINLYVINHLSSDSDDTDNSEEDDSNQEDDTDDSDNENDAEDEDDTDTDSEDEDDESDDTDTDSDDQESDDNTQQDDNSTQDPDDQNNTENLPPQNINPFHITKLIWDDSSNSWVRNLFIEKEDIAHFNISVNNNGSTSLYNLSIIDFLPIGLDYVHNPIHGNANYTPVYDAQNHTIHWNISEIETNQTINLFYNCTVLDYGTHSNTVNGTTIDINGTRFYANNSAAVSIYGNVTLEKTFWDQNQQEWKTEIITPINTTVRMNITIQYNGSFTLHNLSMIDPLPQGIQFRGNITENNNPIQFLYNQTQHHITWNKSSIQGKATIYLEMDLFITNLTTMTNTAYLTCNESTGKSFNLNAQASIQGIIPEDIVCIKTVGYNISNLSNEIEPDINDIITFSIDITNNRDFICCNMRIIDYLPSIMEYVEDSAVFIFQNSSFTREPTLSMENNTLTWDNIQIIIEDNLGPFEHLSLQFQAKILDHGHVINIANFSTGIFDGSSYHEGYAEDGAFINITPPLDPLAVSLQIPSESFIGDPVQCSATVTGGIPPYQWFWDFGDNSNSTLVQPIHYYTQTGVYTISVNVTDSENTSVLASHVISINEQDTTPPQVNITTPEKLMYFRGKAVLRFFTPIIIGSINITYEARDNETDIDFVQLFIDDTLMKSFSTSTGVWTWDSKEFGKKTIRVQAFDSFGNKGIDEITVWKFL